MIRKPTGSCWKALLAGVDGFHQQQQWKMPSSPSASMSNWPAPLSCSEENRPWCEQQSGRWPRGGSMRVLRLPTRRRQLGRQLIIQQL